MKNSVIIVSGGMDSITLLYDHKDEIALEYRSTTAAIIMHAKYLTQRCIANDSESST